MSILLQDVRFAVRMLLKHRLATLVLVLALALGIGANTAMFSVAEAFLLHPVPIPHVDRLAALFYSRPQLSLVDLNPIAPATYFEWKQQMQSCDELAAYYWDEVNLTGDREPQKVQAFGVTSNFFHLVDVYPETGRAFLPEEEQIGKDHEIILSHGLWERRYGSDPNILNKTVNVDGLPLTVVGVMGKGFTFPYPAEAWVPLGLTAAQTHARDTRFLWVLGHLRRGATVSQSFSELQAISQQQANAYPDAYKGWIPRMLPLAEFTTGDLTRQYTLLLLGAVGFVLLIACVNVANVQLARMSGRAKEFAVRTTLGGTRWRIVRQLLTESIILSLVGAAVGLFIAQWEIQLILKYMPADVARFIAGWYTIHLDTGAFLFTLAIAFASGVFSGVFPSLLISRSTIGNVLKESGRGTSSGWKRLRLRNALVVSEVSLALILLVGAGLLVKNFRGLLTVNDGFHPETILTMNLTLSDAQYAQPSARAAFHEQALERLAGLPGVTSSALASSVPYANGGGVGQQSFTVEDRASVSRDEIVNAVVQTASPSYLRMLNIELRDGRLLADSDRDGTLPVCLVSESLVRRYFNGQNPLGHKIHTGDATSKDPWMTVVGVVRDVRYSWINKELLPTIYRSFRQSPRSYATLLLRTDGSDPSRLAPGARAAIAEIDPNLPLYNVKTFDRVIVESIIGVAYVATMMAILGFVALVLASIGIYGVMSYAVTERTHEIGIRMSLGAETRDILSLVLRNGVLLTAIGLIIGLPVAIFMARGLSGLLFGVDASDPVALVALPLLLAAVALLACYLPAQRASRVDPLQALRYE
jgi:putative ABC transport system permease protein